MRFTYGTKEVYIYSRQTPCPQCRILYFPGVLQVLWLNDNALSRIDNLDYNSTIKSLYVHNNRIGTLKVKKVILRYGGGVI